MKALNGLLLATLAVTGCTRWTGMSQARGAALREGMTALHFSAPSQTVLSMAALKPQCDVGPDGQQRCNACDGKTCVTLVDDYEGSHVTDVSAGGTEAQVAATWSRLDTTTLSRFQHSPDWELETLHQLDLEAARFTPIFGLMAGVTSSFSIDGATDLGLRLGARRWLDVNVPIHALFEYQYRQAVSEHRLTLRAGAELARFTPGRFLGRVGAPPASFSAFIGPSLLLSSGKPTMRVRTGVGAQATDWFWAPMLLEFSADTDFSADRPSVSLFVTFGFGL